MLPPAPPADAPLVTLIIPARNEEANIPALEAEVTRVVETLPYRFEFLVIDNASRDRTPELVKAICARDPRWRYIRFSRDFNVDASMAAGYHYARGDAIMVLHSDLQDPPSVIPRFLEKWREGYDVVLGTRTVRAGDPRWRNLMVWIAYRLIGWFSEVEIPNDTGDFRLVSRPVRDAIERIGEVNRYTRGIVAWLGFRTTQITYQRQPRHAGESKAPLVATVLYVFDAVTSFSLKPLRLFSAFGFLVLAAAVFASAAYVVAALVGHPPPGITTLVLLAFAGIGINSLGIGILGEYVGRTYAEVKHRPLYLVEQAVNVEPEVLARGGDGGRP